MNYANIPERLERVANLSEFAAHCGLSRRQLQRIRQGKCSPTLATCQKIADAFAAFRPKKK